MVSLTNTAFLTMYPRIFTDIPYSKTIYSLTTSEIKNLKLSEDTLKLKRPLLAPELEYRFKVIDQVVSKFKPDTVIEIGAGLSSRGLNYTQKGIKYYEVDLPEICKFKTTLYDTLRQDPDNDFNNLPNIITGNVLNEDTWEKLNKLLDSPKTTFINEGLLRYLSKSEKSYVAKKISKCLKKTTGNWVTADVTLAQLLNSQKKSVLSDNSSTASFITNRSDNYTFDSVESAQSFFQNKTGMTVEIHKPGNIPLASKEYLGLTEDEIKFIIANIYIFEMRHH